MEEKRYYQKEIETMPLEEIQRIQSEKIVKQVKNVYDNVKYYRDLMDAKGVSPEDIKGIEDIHKLPFVSKADLREAYPFGMLARPLSDCVRIHSTSGTTGKRVVAYYTQHDIDLWDECCARAIVAAGGDENDIRLPDPSYVIGKYRQTDAVHHGYGGYDTLLHSFICGLLR